MDYNLAALKLFCGQLKDARETSSPSAMTFRGILFQRAWLQGVLVSCGNNAGHFVLDDGTGVIDIFVMNAQHEWKIGMYVMVVGAFILRIGEAPMIKVFCFDSIFCCA
ncbi:hypothetical protein GIB67_005717 [Kingdonia uniflora]|uniref:Uncharacterized protein n=1 Tax=Kingdonia uniflora TaxID=39325 RepID=A0A7J7KVD7_9MAGN|nr:hypothetical protein GIB67_005717 [Kingdonia uniflora]